MNMTKLQKIDIKNLLSNFPTRLSTFYHDKQYLCVIGNRFFVSDICFISNPDWSLKPNSTNNGKNVCVYVDDVQRKECISISDLEELYFIQKI